MYDENVYLCETGDQLVEVVKNNWCVAIYDHPEDEYPTFMGDVEVPYEFGKKLERD